MYGGYWSKIGNQFEGRWVLRQAVLLTGPFPQNQSVKWEPVGDDELGIDVWVERIEGIRECHQCKKGPVNKSEWSIQGLGQAGIFKEIQFQLNRDKKHQYRLISRVPAPSFDYLTTQARHSESAESFWMDQVLPSADLKSALTEVSSFFELNPETQEDLSSIWDLLRRSRFILWSDIETSQRTLAGLLRVAGNPKAALRVLGDWLGENYRRRITVTDLARELHSFDLSLIQTGEGQVKEFHFQISKPEIRRTLRRYQRRFSESLRHNLAGGQLIPRSETQEILKHLATDDTRLVVVHGVAGVGKSGVLLELTRELQEQETPFLPLRLDRVEPKVSPETFGKALEFPTSPEQSLSLVLDEEQHGVLILDQLDALRWTGAHYHEAWDVCREMIDQALLSRSKLKIVVCCRTFDLEHDPQFRGWESTVRSGEPARLQKVKVEELTEEQVQGAVQRGFASPEGARDLDPQEMQLLRLVFHLKMWLELPQELRDKCPIQSRRALLDEFWAHRREQLQKAGLSPDRLNQIEERLVEATQQGARLSVPLSSLKLNREEKEAYQTFQILQVQADTRRVSFCHQNYLDHLVAVRLVDDLERQNGDLATWLGPKEEQSLFRREQLRLVLEELRERDPQTYITELRGLVDSGQRVRFHLRLLGLQFLSQQDSPLPAEKDFVLTLLEQDFWREHVLSSVVWDRVVWFEVLDGAGYFEAWLGGNDERMCDLALRFLRYFAQWKGDRVAALLQPYLDKDGNWNARLVNHLPLEPSQDSEDIFKLRCELAKRGLYDGGFFDWHALAEQHPGRVPRLAEQLLLALARDLEANRERTRPGRRAELDWRGLDQISPDLVPKETRERCWAALARGVLAVVNARHGQTDRILEGSDFQYETLAPVIEFLRALSGSILENDWRVFLTLREDLPDAGQRNEILFLYCLCEGPAQTAFADWALEWLMADPWRVHLRLKLGDGRWRLSGELVERFAPVCSTPIFEKLEEWLLAYVEPDLAELYRARHQWLDQDAIGWIHSSVAQANSFGRTPLALLSKLPADLRSTSAKRRIAELERKFGPPRRSDYADGESSSGGWVRSPLKDEARQIMSDEAWFKLISNPKLRRGQDTGRWTGDRFEEASPEMFGSDLREATKQEPNRFGRLLVERWPADAHPKFTEAILSGLADAGRPAGAEQEPQKPSHELLEQVLALPLVRNLAQANDDRTVAHTICRLLSGHPDYPWSDEALGLLSWIAQNHQDPTPNYFPVGSLGRGSDPMELLQDNALNVTRGSTGFTIRSLLFKQPELLEKLQPAIESLAQDPHPAVRVGALAACLPLLNVDRDGAVQLFLQAAQGPDAILATHEASEFLHYAHHTHLQELLPTIDRMLTTDSDEVTTTGASLVAAAFFFHERIEDRFEECTTGSEAQRKEVAEIATALLENEEHAEEAKKILLRLADDPSDEVLWIVARSLRNLDLQRLQADPEAWTTFAGSKAFRREPSPLLHALKNQSGDLLPFADCLFAAGRAFVNDKLKTNLTLSHEAFPLLLRLYEQAKDQDPQIEQRCLDLWDDLLENRVDTALSLTKELDQR